MSISDAELERAIRKAGANPENCGCTWLAFLGWIRYAYDLGTNTCERTVSMKIEDSTVTLSVSAANQEFIDKLLEESKTHPPTNQCTIPECMVCGVRDCPEHEPLHYDKDGCPCRH